MIKVDFKNGKGLLSGDHFLEIREHFSIENPALKYNYGRNFFIPKRLYAITPKGQFKIGLIHEIKEFVISRGYKGGFEITQEAQKHIQPKLDKKLIQRLSKELRYYQVDSLNSCLENGRGILLLGTGAGKTLTCAGLIDNFYLYAKDLSKFKCLIMVPNVGLASQTYNDFKEYGVSFTFTLWTGKNDPDLDCNVIIANTSILLSRFSLNDWIEDVDLLIVDECHGLGAKNEITKLVSSIKTPNKFGLTGTLPENIIDRWNITGLLGKVIMEKSSAELRSENFLTNVKVKVFNLEYASKPPKISNTNTTDRYFAELEFLSKNKFRNSIIEKICTNFKNNILIMINNLDHGQELFDQLSKIQSKQVFYIKGEVEVQDREIIKDIMEKNDNVVCIAISAIFSTGINIKNIHAIVFAAGGKSFTRIVQSIGRGLRLNENKDNLLIVDILDKLEYGIKHGQKRKEIYNKECIEYTDHIVTEKSN